MGCNASEVNFVLKYMDFSKNLCNFAAQNVSLRMRRGKHIVALLLLSLYMVAMALPACVSVSCRCDGMALEQEHNGCRCSHCLEAQNCDSDLVVTEHCGCNHHSTEIALYTAPSNEEEESGLRCAEIDLLCMPAVALAAPEIAEKSCYRPVAPDIPTDAGYGAATSLRAPPALV